MLINNKNIGYAKEAQVLGAIVAVNLLDDTVTLMDDNGDTHVVGMETVIELREAGTLENQYVYEGDVLEIETIGRKYEVIVTEDNKLQMAWIDEKLNRVDGGLGMAFAKEELATFANVAKLVGSIHELRNNLPTVDFNLATYRSMVGGEVSYFYAGNDKTTETVDLIKVLFVGHHILEEEEYERKTVTYEQFLAMVASGELKEVNPMEIANYVAGKAYGQTTAPSVTSAKVEISDEGISVFDASGFEVENEDEDEDEEDYEICEDCGENEEDCDCELW